MRVIRIISIIGLASYLALQGLYYLAEGTSPALHAAIGLVGLITGALIFISLGHWINVTKDSNY